jgi:lysosomal acid lipase/cholesteryl ester hydrolase
MHPAIIAANGSDPEVDMTTPQIIAHWGYPAQIVTVTTTDGYILEMHRIPFGKNSGPTKNPKPVIFLQHGFECSSSNWVTNLPNEAAAFIFADAGFDVWLGNMRGNTYSKAHTHLSPTSHEFWQFSWDEMVKYDLDAMIDKVLQVTGQPHLYYVGHSQGTQTMFVKLSIDQNFHTKIRKYFALAPVTTTKHARGLLYVLAEYFYPEVQLLLQLVGENEFLPNSWITELIAKLICGSSNTNKLCDSILFLIGGPDSNQLNNTRLPVYLSHTPAGTSTTNVLHWAQNIRSGLQQAYDWGSAAANIIHYGSAHPPVYNMSRVNAPTYLFWSDADWLADTQDVTGYLIPNLNPSILMQNTNLHDFNHWDFIWGLRAAREVYQPIVDIIRADV